MILFTVLLVLCSTLVKGQAVIKASTQTIQNLDAEIRGLLRADRSRIGGFVRLSFHDCVGDRCDGCIDHTNSDNAGMRLILFHIHLQPSCFVFLEKYLKYRFPMVVVVQFE